MDSLYLNEESNCQVDKCCMLTLGFLSLLALLSKTCLALSCCCPNGCGAQCKTLRQSFKVESIFLKNLIFIEINFLL